MKFTRVNLMKDYNDEHGKAYKVYVWDCRSPMYDVNNLHHLLGEVAFFGADVVSMRIVKHRSETPNRLGNHSIRWVLGVIRTNQKGLKFEHVGEFATKKDAVEFAEKHYPMNQI